MIFRNPVAFATCFAGALNIVGGAVILIHQYLL